MTLVTYEPKHFLSDFFGNEGFFPKGLKDPFYGNPAGDLKVNVSEDEHGYHMSAVVPGWKEDEVHLEVNDDVLTLRGNHEEKTEEDKSEFKMREFVRRSFERSFRLGDHVDQDQISAKLEEGILNIHLPKKEEVKPKTQRIKIN
ncbi:MAG: Hsp20/alpha crystallin family protein [Candidatus Nitronauta litoralis]|uniref:Hsp20/alpha crystallin family protein n=1 Tax=Candidatus Nitronauta litoralis TaxID=2705533 RepID=A0A7T0BXC2_9BACT|nr:MAG: Hsp20/alpha crystallin family protein [Candidatus Nitronauta litoralis]